MISIHLPWPAPCRCNFNDTGQRQKQQGRHAVTGYKSTVRWRMLGCHGLSPTVGGIVAVPLVSYRPSQAGQPLTSKMLTRHSLPVSMGAWSSGLKDRLYIMHQAKEDTKGKFTTLRFASWNVTQCVLASH